MRKLDKYSKIHELLKEVFPKDDIPNDSSNLAMGDLKGWDSLGNFNLILAIETEFNIRFHMDQMTKIRSVKEIVEALETGND